jgi:hypothetical protein
VSLPRRPPPAQGEFYCDWSKLEPAPDGEVESDVEDESLVSLESFDDVSLELLDCVAFSTSVIGKYTT